MILDIFKGGKNISEDNMRSVYDNASYIRGRPNIQQIM